MVYSHPAPPATRMVFGVDARLAIAAALLLLLLLLAAAAAAAAAALLLGLDLVC